MTEKAKPPKASTRHRHVVLRLTVAERERYEEAAQRAGLTLSSWVRHTLAENDPGVDAVEPGGVLQAPLEPARQSLRVPVSVAEAEELKGIAAAAGMPLGSWARLALRGQRPRQQRSVADQALLEQLRRIGGNVNQLVRLAHAGRLQIGEYDSLTRELEAVRTILGTVERALVEEPR